MPTHYIFVRRDLPIGVIASMVTHAAGESAALYEYHYGRFDGATAVVLEAKNEDHLFDIRDYLEDHNIDHMEVCETGGPYNDQFMAIGLIPLDNDEEYERVKDLLKDYQTLKTCLDNSVTGG